VCVCVTERQMCILIPLQVLPKTFLSLRTEWDMIKNLYWSSLNSCQILMKLEFSQKFFEKNIQICDFLKIHPVGAESFYFDRWRDRQT